MRALIIALAATIFSVGLYADSIPVANHSFEEPATQYVDPVVADWDEVDLDPGSQNTGVFFNGPGDSYITNADANQIGFVIGMEGNAFQQELAATYQVGNSYRMTVGVCVSFYSPPPSADPLELTFYYLDEGEPNDIVVTEIIPTGLSYDFLDDFSVTLPAVDANDPWAGETIGIAIRGTGAAGGAWDLDDVRVVEYPLTPNFTDDSVVNLADFAPMAAEWFSCDDPLTDVTGDGCVDEQDLFVFVLYWLDNV